MYVVHGLRRPQVLPDPLPSTEQNQVLGMDHHYLK